MNKSIIGLTFVSLSLLLPTAEAAYIVTATETGGNVLFEGSGTIDLTGTIFATTVDQGTILIPSRQVSIGVPALADIYNPSSITGPASIGPGTGFANDTTNTGDLTGFSWHALEIIVPTGYTSNSRLSGSSTFAGATFSSLGLAPGVYEWTWATGATTDSFILNVGAVPIPSAVWLFGSGLLGLIGVARRKARA